MRHHELSSWIAPFKKSQVIIQNYFSNLRRVPATASCLLSIVQHGRTDDDILSIGAGEQRSTNAGHLCVRIPSVGRTRPWSPAADLGTFCTASKQWCARPVEIEPNAVQQCFSTFLLEWNPLERLRCSQKPLAGFIPFQIDNIIWLVVHKTLVYVCNTVHDVGRIVA